MKLFDIEKAQAGHPVQTRDKHDVRILCFNRKDNNFPIVGLINKNNKEICAEWTINGRFAADNHDNEHDLFMKPVKKEGWINIYRNKESGADFTSDLIYDDYNDAFSSASGCDYVTTTKIEWEE